MEAREYRTTDKTAWGDGPWQSEPDKAQWQDAATGLPCLIVRGPSGALCGYVGVDQKHPAYGLSHDGTPHAEHQAHRFAVRAKMREAFKDKTGAESHEAVREALGDFPSPPEKVPDIGERISGVEVHGGLTFADACSPGPEEHAICHVPGPGETDQVWWFGFDCAHFMDYSPKMAANMRGMDGILPTPQAFRDMLERAREREVYRDLAYVKAECASLAKQLAGMA